MTGGTVTVDGPTNGGNGALDYSRSIWGFTAYNLDGGGSSTLYFNGEALNETVGGQGESERSVSDIVTIGY